MEVQAQAVEGESFATTSFRVGVFYRLIDTVIQGLTCHFEAVKRIDDLFGFLVQVQKNDRSGLNCLVIVFQQII